MNLLCKNMLLLPVTSNNSCIIHRGYLIIHQSSGCYIWTLIYPYFNINNVPGSSQRHFNPHKVWVMKNLSRSEHCQGLTLIMVIWNWWLWSVWCHSLHVPTSYFSLRNYSGTLHMSPLGGDFYAPPPPHTHKPPPTMPLRGIMIWWKAAENENFPSGNLLDGDFNAWFFNRVSFS